jgi:hypothetical protein
MHSISLNTILSVFSLLLLFVSSCSTTDYMQEYRQYRGISSEQELGAPAKVALSPAVANHGPVEEGHIQTAENYIDHKLKEEGQFSVVKIEQFIGQIIKERESLAQDRYESKIIEKIQFKIVSLKKAKKSALDELDQERSELLLAYNRYMLPKLYDLLDCVKRGGSDSSCHPYADDFITVYASYYLPDAPRRVTHHDLDYLSIIKNTLGYRLSKGDKRAPEPFNLTVTATLKHQIDLCLEQEKDIGSYLSHQEIIQLENCGFDTSKLNPSSGPLWRKMTDQRRKEARDLHLEWFPSTTDKIYLKHLKYSSAGSPKMKAYFYRDPLDSQKQGKRKKINLKIKFGLETHTEITTSVMGRMLGLTQDPVIHRPVVRLYLDGITFSGFKAQWKRKYNRVDRGFVTYVKSHGFDQDGNEWVDLRDVQLSVKDPNMHRLSVYHPDGWDLPNRREHRAMMLWYGWMGIIDTKAGNHKVMLRKGEGGVLEPVYSLQDVGYSLQASIDIRRPLHVMHSIGSLGVNTYLPSFLTWSDDHVHVWWSELMMDKQRFSTTNYSDLKWMARKIAQISYDDILYAINVANYPDPVADLYRHKIVNRRNEIVKAFGLQEEHPLYQAMTPDQLKKYSPNKYVKKGKVVVDHFEGYASYERPRNTLFPAVLGYLARSISFNKLDANFTTTVGRRLSQTASMGKTLWDGKRGDEVSISALGVGMNVDISRTVDINSQSLNYKDGAQAFVVKDRVTISVNMGNSLYSRLIKEFPVSLHLGLQVWRKEFQFIHFAPTWQEGYRKGFKLLNFIQNWKRSVAYALEAGEILKISDSFGLANGSVSASFDTSKLLPSALATSLGAYYSWHHATPVYFGRDFFGELYIYKENINSKIWGVGITLSDIDLYLVNLPVMGIHFSHVDLQQQGALYRFKMPQHDVNLDALNQEQREHDLKALNTFLRGDSDHPSVLARLEYNLEGTGWHQRVASKFLLFWRKNSSRGYSKAEVKLASGKKRIFHRYYKEQKGMFGSDELISFGKEKNITVMKRNSRSTTIELDNDDPKSMMIMIDIGDYHRKFSRKKLVKHIGAVNKLFSESKDKPFFRGFILPSKEEVSHYRKLYTKIKIFINGESINTKFLTMSKKDIRQLVKDYVGYHGVGNIQPDQDDPDYGLYQRYSTMSSGLLAIHRKLRRSHGDPEKYLKLVVKLVEVVTKKRNIFSTRINHHERGLTLLRKLVGKNKLFVMGEIYGIYPSFSILQQNEALVDRRFAGRSWGNFSGLPPIRKFLHDHDLDTSSIFVDGGLGLESILGSLPRPNSVDYY